MLGRAGCQDQRHSIATAVCDPYAGAGAINDLNAGSIRRLSNKGKRRDQLGATSEVSCRDDARQLRMQVPQVSLQSPEPLSGMVDEPLPTRTPQEFDPGQDLSLEGRPEALGAERACSAGQLPPGHPGSRVQAS